MQDNQELSGQEQENPKEKKEGFFAELKKSGSKLIGIIFIAVIVGGVIGSGIGAVIGFAIFAGIGLLVTWIKGGGLGKAWNGIKSFFGSKENEKTQELSQNEDITQSNNVDTTVSNTIRKHTSNLEDKITTHDDNQFLQENKPQNNKENYDKSLEGNLVNFNNEMYLPNHQEVPQVNVDNLYQKDNEEVDPSESYVVHNHAGKLNDINHSEEMSDEEKATYQANLERVLKEKAKYRGTVRS
jgi:hypothetical protein